MGSLKISYDNDIFFSLSIPRASRKYWFFLVARGVKYLDDFYLVRDRIIDSLNEIHTYIQAIYPIIMQFLLIISVFTAAVAASVRITPPHPPLSSEFGTILIPFSHRNVRSLGTRGFVMDLSVWM